MRIKRTANAGVLLEMDGQRILLDGVCGEIKPYIPTPAAEVEALRRRWPDVVGFTHSHEDHFDAGFAQEYHQQTLRPILGPESLPVTSCDEVTAGQVRVRAMPTRHLGRAGQTPHVSFLVEGSQRVLFTGDATPIVWRKIADLPKVDVIICPYAYATTPSGWEIVKQMAPKAVVLVHFPRKDDDPCGLWPAALQMVTGDPVGVVYIPEMGQGIDL